MRHAILDSSFDDEVVEDSEPEREMNRRKNASPGERRFTRPALPPPERDSATPTSASSGSGPVSPTFSRVSEAIYSVHQRRGSPEYDAPGPVVVNPVNDELDFDDEPPAPLNLDRFAFKASTGLSCASRPTSSTSRSSSLLSSTKPQVQEIKRPVKRSTASVSTWATQFSETQLGALLVCVCCDTKWTVRKTTVQKLAHIKTCAKKRAFTNETVASLISQELASSPPKPLEQAKPTKETPCPPAQSQARTLLENVMLDAGKNKKPKKAIETVESIVNTRSDILDRAKTMLAEDIQPIRRPTGKAKAKSNMPASAVGSTACPPFDEDQTSEIIDAFPSTQRFAPSKFGVAVCSSNLFRQADQSDINISDLDEPISRPQTPEFLPCKLLGSSSKLLQPSPSSSKKRTAVPGGTIPLSNLPIQSELLSRLDRDLPQTNASASTSQSPPKPTKAVAALTYPLSTIPDEYGIPPEDFVDESDPWRDENDGGDAWLHYDPEVSAGLTTLHTPPSRTPKKTVYAPGERLLEKARLSTKRRGRKAQPSSDQEDGLDWKQRLKNEIINNEAMYLRILRYEPIHFDEFLSLMPEKSSGISRVALKSFLDEQAIHYHGAGPGWKRK